MNYCNCKKCNKIFNYIKGPMLCYDCDQIIFESIKKYINENPGATSSMISNDLNLPIKIIQDYVKDNRLTKLRADVKLCLLCKDVIDGNGTYCNSCLKKMDILNKMNSLSSKSNSENIVPKMHFLNSDNVRKKR